MTSNVDSPTKAPSPTDRKPSTAGFQADLCVPENQGKEKISTDFLTDKSSKEQFFETLEWATDDGDRQDLNEEDIIFESNRKILIRRLGLFVACLSNWVVVLGERLHAFF